MIDDFMNREVRSSGELWTEICSGLPEAQSGAAAAAAVEEEVEENRPDFRDSFHPAGEAAGRAEGQAAGQATGLANGTSTGSCCAAWEPMEDSEVYIASLENRLKKLKGQSTDVTSRDMLRSLSQAKKECWDRFLHDAQTSELFQGGDMDEGALEHFKRWLIPEKVAISAEELEYLLRPSQSREPAAADETQDEDDTDGETHKSEEDDAHSPEK